MKTKILKCFLAASLLVTFAVACKDHGRPLAGEYVVAPGETEVPEAPPPPQLEVETASPGPDFVWIGGVWIWGPEGRWVWEKGHWDRPPHPGAVWEPHRYAVHGGKKVFVRGGWR